MRHLWMGLAVVLMTSAAFGAPEKGKASRGSRVTLKAAPYAPFRIEGSWREVQGSLQLGSATFKTQVVGEQLLVADAPDGEPKRKVKSGSTLRFTWTEGERRRVEKLRFERTADGVWRCHLAEAVRFKLGRAQLALIDCDADGIHGEFGVDGILLGSTTHAIPLQQEMLIGLQTVKFLAIEPDGSSIRTEREDFDGPRPQLLVLAFLNYLRRAHGFSPVVLDEELSRGCTEHAEYLAANAWNGVADPHEQDPKLQKATEAGHAAAGVSVVMKMPPIASLRAHYVTWYHRFGMMHPRLTRVGINATQPTLTVIDVWRGRAKGEEGAALHDRPWFCPADGVVGVPPGSGPELPREPVADLASRGFPLMVYFPLEGGEITAFGGELRTGRRGRTKIHTLVVKPDKKGIAGLVPAKRLKAKTWYEARYNWTRDGKSRNHVIRFRTH